MLVIGSVAAKYWIPSFRQHQDMDVWALPHDFFAWYDHHLPNLAKVIPQENPNKLFVHYNDNGNLLKMEVRLLTEGGPHMEMYKANASAATIYKANTEWSVASLKTLLKLKRSHIEHPLRWQKHIEDYSVLLKEYNKFKRYYDEHQDNERLEAAYKTLYKMTNDKLGTTKVNLNMSNEEFFAQSQEYIKRVYDHDSLHRAVMFYDAPLYERMKDDKSRAMCSKRLWETFSELDKVRAVQEESMVIALERRVLPRILKGKAYDAKKAYDYALMRICTNLTSGWFRDFAIDHWVECSQLGFDYVSRFNEKHARSFTKDSVITEALEIKPYKV